MTQDKKTRIDKLFADMRTRSSMHYRDLHSHARDTPVKLVHTTAEVSKASTILANTLRGLNSSAHKKDRIRTANGI